MCLHYNIHYMSSLVDKWHKSKIRKNVLVIEVESTLKMFVLSI